MYRLCWCLQVGVVYRFDISSGADTKSWLVDLKNGDGSITVW